HIAGTLGVALFDRFVGQRWLVRHDQGTRPRQGGPAYRLTTRGRQAFDQLGLDVEALVSSRRRFAFACLDWSERRPHLGGALGAAVLQLARRRRWVEQDLDSRALRVTTVGRRELQARFGV